MTLKSLMNQQTAGGKGLLAAEILTTTDRRHGPINDKCEVCGEAAERFVLQDWLNWHCIPCVERVVRAEFAAAMAA